MASPRSVTRLRRRRGNAASGSAATTTRGLSFSPRSERGRDARCRAMLEAIEQRLVAGAQIEREEANRAG
jgi:hypothetical protein